MPALQQTTAPTPPATRVSTTPQAPQAPTAPNAPVIAGSPTPQQRDDIAHQARDMAQQAREMARIVREQSRQGPVNSTSTPPQFPFDPNLLRNTAENIANSFFLTIAVIAIGIPLVRAIGRRFGPAPAPAVIPPAMTDQLHRIETAVESMAIEIERISESQRFLAKLQTGKSEMAALPRSGAGGA